MAGSISASKAKRIGLQKGGHLAAFFVQSRSEKQVPGFWPFADKSGIRAAEDALATARYRSPANPLQFAGLAQR
jgi:hypothetical protein